jgi:hypothetical protein
MPTRTPIRQALSLGCVEIDDVSLRMWRVEEIMSSLFRREGVGLSVRPGRVFEDLLWDRGFTYDPLLLPSLVQTTRQ